MAEIQCPKCGADAFNRYGRTANGKQRYICLVCNRQFIHMTNGDQIKKRPKCPFCGGFMHVYMHRGGTTRFRCSAYPNCRGFAKVGDVLD